MLVALVGRDTARRVRLVSDCAAERPYVLAILGPERMVWRLEDAGEQVHRQRSTSGGGERANDSRVHVDRVHVEIRAGRQ